MNDPIDQRFRYAVERILGNSRLTADLNDQAAQVLLEWGIDQAKNIVSAPVEPMNESDPSRSQEERLQANQKMMRLINNWVSGRFRREPQQNTAYLEQILTEASKVYDQRFVPKSEPQRARFIREHLGKDRPEDLISELRIFLEN